MNNSGGYNNTNPYNQQPIPFSSGTGTGMSTPSSMEQQGNIGSILGQFELPSTGAPPTPPNTQLPNTYGGPQQPPTMPP